MPVNFIDARAKIFEQNAEQSICKEIDFYNKILEDILSSWAICSRHEKLFMHFSNFDFFHYFWPPLLSKFNSNLHPESSSISKKSCIILILTHFDPHNPSICSIRCKKKAPREWTNYLLKFKTLLLMSRFHKTWHE